MAEDTSSLYSDDGFSSDAELDFTETDALPSPAEEEKSSKFKRSGSIYNGFDDGDAHDDAASAAAGTPPATTTGDDDVGDIGFELSQDEVEAMEMDHKKVYSKDMAFANSMTADEEVKEQELQRLQLEALLRVKGGGDSMDAALSSIDLSALTMSSANASAADTPELKSKREKRKEKGKAKGKAKAVAPATVQLVPETAAEIAANPALMSKAQLRLHQRRQLRAQMAKAQQQAQQPAKKDRPNVSKIGDWGEVEVAKWLGTIVEGASVHQWMSIVKRETIDGRKLLELTADDLATYTKGYLTISKEVTLVSEGIRRLNFEGAKAGRMTLRKAIGKKLGM